MILDNAEITWRSVKTWDIPRCNNENDGFNKHAGRVSDGSQKIKLLNFCSTVYLNL